MDDIISIIAYIVVLIFSINTTIEEAKYSTRLLDVGWRFWLGGASFIFAVTMLTLHLAGVR